MQPSGPRVTEQPEATPFGTAPASTEQCVVVGVGADPTPHDPVSVKSADSAMMDTDADRPEISPHLLEVQRGMKRILLPEPIGLRRGLANVPWQLAVCPPKLPARDARNPHDRPSTRSASSRMVSSGTARPASITALEFAMSPSSRPAARSAAIWRSQPSSAEG